MNGTAEGRPESTRYRIMLSNVGYARGIDGSLRSHVRHSYRYLYCPRRVQRRAIDQLKALIHEEDPDLCCLIEIDKGSVNTAFFNQMSVLVGPTYAWHDIENKYGSTSLLRRLPVSSGKCNGFLSKRSLDYEKIYFTVGTKRLIYKIKLAPGLTVFFAHFSLRRAVRREQFQELRRVIDDTEGNVIVLGDFNIFDGHQELAPLLEQGDLELVSDPTAPTFVFSGNTMALDLCFCSKALAAGSNVRVRHQEYSDHFAVILEFGA